MSINLAVSKNIKEIREQKKLTLDMAANLTGVSRSMLAQIERGDANPTISVLWKIANGYKVAFTTLVEEKSDSTNIIYLNEEESIIENDGKYINYPVFKFNEESKFETYFIKIIKEGNLEAEPHLPYTKEYITVFKGEVEISVLDEKYILKKGDSISFNADVYHSYKNIGDKEVLLNMILHYNK